MFSTAPLAIPKPGPKRELDAVIVMDYQSVHLTGHGRFCETDPLHDCLVDPAAFAARTLAVRNTLQQVGHRPARPKRIAVYRGQPDETLDPEGSAINNSQADEWRASDSRVRVFTRALTYTYFRDAEGRKRRDIHGRLEVDRSAKPSGKGGDVLCALALTRAARENGTDVVFLATSDTDLIPAINEVIDEQTAKAETVFWCD